MRSVRMAALAVAITLACSGLAVARDHDDDHSRHADRDQHHDRAHNDRWRGNNGNRGWSRGDGDHDRDDRWRGNNGNRGWWHGDGDQDRDDRWRDRERRERADHDRNDGYYNRGGSVYRSPYGYPGGYGYPTGGYGYPGASGRGSGGAGYSMGYQDGSYQARKDVAQGKPFNPNPRGASHSDHGYNGSYGDKYGYQASYNQGYRSGYEANFRGGRGYGGNRGWGF